MALATVGLGGVAPKEPEIGTLLPIFAPILGIDRTPVIARLEILAQCLSCKCPHSVPQHKLLFCEREVHAVSLPLASRLEHDVGWLEISGHQISRQSSCRRHVFSPIFRGRKGPPTIARILLINSSLVGQLHASAELLTRLRAQGHDVVSAGPEANQPVMAAAGIRFSTLPDYPLGGPRIARPRSLQERLPAGRRARLREGLKALGVAGLPGLLGAIRPDLVLIDFEMHAHIMTTRALGYRVALFTAICAGLPGLRAPPNHTTIVPGTRMRGSQLGVAAAWLGFWIEKHRRRLGERLRYAGADYASILLEHARTVGFDSRLELTPWRWQIPFSYRRLPLLLFHARDFDLPAPTSERVRYVGPMVAQTRLATPQLRARFDGMIAELTARRADPSTKLIYVAFGTIKAPRAAFMARLWETIRRNPDWVFVVVTGRPDAIEIPKNAGDNLRIIECAPQPDILRIVDAAIVHAGSNTIVECIEAGVPMLSYPFSTNDQKGNAARILYHGLGIVGRMSDLSEKIERDLHQVVNDSNLQDKVDCMRRSFRRYAEEQVAERAIEQLLAPRQVNL